MSVNQLVNELKQNNDDYEFYPTTDAMLDVIAPFLDQDTVLDIGCGTCKFKKYMDRRARIEEQFYIQRQERRKAEVESRGYSYYYDKRDFTKISKYYVFEKSKTLLNKLEDDAIVLGTDFMENILIDKKVSVIFCNPPYSEFEEWTKKILSEGNFIKAFMVIPQRWKDNVEIKSLLEYLKTDARVLGSFDFLDAERKARAKVDVVLFTRREKSYSNRNEDFDRDCFDMFFNKTFGINKTFEENSKDRNETDYDIERKQKKSQESRIKNALTVLDEQREQGKTKEGRASVLVRLYEEDYNKLLNNLKAIMQLDEDVLKSFNISINNIKEALIQKMQGLKVLYWDMVWNEFSEITDRLTYGSREEIRKDYQELNCMDFTLGNIYALILWVIKNANKYYNSQLIDFYKKLSSESNVKPYKSNQRLFEKDGWYWSCEGKRDYVLDYRIIMSSPFRVTWSGKLDNNYYSADRTLSDIKTIAKNLGFNVGCLHQPENFGEKTYIYMDNLSDEVFMEYKVYMNGNMHVKFNKEFTKALNVEVARLLGWIRCKEDIKREFPDNMAKGSEKYFKTNYTCIGSNLLLLTAK